MVSSLIAIDGPAGAGKSTVGQAVADRLGYRYLDTGAMYRAVTWAALQRGIDTDDQAAVTDLAADLDIDIVSAEGTSEPADDGRQYTVYADGEDVTWALRRPEVDAHVSAVAAYPGVREALVKQQRRIAARGHAVIVGRDIGTVVLPNADVKIYLDASVEERARRRYRERLCQGGDEADFTAILRDMRQRDARDRSRKTAPLRRAEDAVVIDTDDLSIEEVVSRVMDVV